MGFKNLCPQEKGEKSSKNKYSSFISNRRDIPEPESEPENSMEGICPSLKEIACKKLN